MVEVVPGNLVLRAGMWPGRLAPCRDLAVRQALAEGTARVLADDRASSVLVVRRGAGQVEVMGLGKPGPALEWLAEYEQIGPLALLAPEEWAGPASAAIGVRGGAMIRTWTEAPEELPAAGLARVRRLGAGDEPGFRAAAPAWAGLTWSSFGRLIGAGAAFGVEARGGFGFAALAWVHEQDESRDALAVWTGPGYRRLGLGYSAAAALMRHVVEVRGKRPTWTCGAENAASVALTGRLGLTGPVDEGLLRRGTGR
ncbi:GNAT family N-acetyltransferase [Isosphaeraceae bacterium EP7]